MKFFLFFIKLLIKKDQKSYNVGRPLAISHNQTFVLGSFPKVSL
jgi:hypothetical protein